MFDTRKKYICPGRAVASVSLSPLSLFHHLNSATSTRAKILLSFANRFAQRQNVLNIYWRQRMANCFYCHQKSVANGKVNLLLSHPHPSFSRLSLAWRQVYLDTRFVNFTSGRSVRQCKMWALKRWIEREEREERQSNGVAGMQKDAQMHVYSKMSVWLTL